jgi:hypothetical protein
MRRLLGAVSEEVDMAVITPGAREQLFTTGGGIQRGTGKGEVVRSFFLFKSFPIAVVMRHWSRALGMPSAGGRAAYIATFLASTTLLGALSMQLNDLISGKNPKNPVGEHAGKFWVNALLKVAVLVCTVISSFPIIPNMVEPLSRQCSAPLLA